MFDLRLRRKQILLIGILACIGAFVSVLADLFTGWSASPNSMSTGISIDIDSVKELFYDKPRWSLILGNYLAVFFIPFHMLGFLLIYQAIIPAGRIKALTFLTGSFYFVSVGAGYHGTFAFIADTIQSGDAELLTKMLDYWYGWGLALVVGYVALCLFLFVLVVSGKTLYPRWIAILTPLPFLLFSGFLIMVVPEEFYGTKAFFAVTGLNLPLLFFYIVTMRVLLVREDLDSAP